MYCKWIIRNLPTTHVYIIDNSNGGCMTSGFVLSFFRSFVFHRGEIFSVEKIHERLSKTSVYIYYNTSCIYVRISSYVYVESDGYDHKNPIFIIVEIFLRSVSLVTNIVPSCVTRF